MDNKIWCYSNRYDKNSLATYLECDHNIFKIIEKAWAIYLSKKFYKNFSYQLLDDGGNIDEVIYALSGLECKEYNAKNYFNKEVYEIIKEKYKKGCYVTTKSKINNKNLVNDHVYLYMIFMNKKENNFIKPYDSDMISRHQSIKIDEIKDIVDVFGYVK